MTRGFRMHVSTDTAAFDTDPVPEVVRILRNVIARLESGESFSHYLTLFDVNGNDVGRVKLGDST